MGPETERNADATQRFGPRAAAYARARPGYPDTAIGELLRALGIGAGAHVVDLGSGTGLSSEAFLRAQMRVTGVEPNEAMRSRSLQRLARYPGFCAVDGRAEASGLPDRCADLVVAAQAFHWFDPAAARTEVLRIGAAPAHAALIWNDRRTEGSEFLRGYEELLLRLGRDYLEVRDRQQRPDGIERFFGNHRWRTIHAVHADELDFEMLADRLNSASYVPAPGDPRYGPMMQDLRALFDATALAGRVSMEFETRIHFGSVEAPEPGTQRGGGAVRA